MQGLILHHRLNPIDHVHLSMCLHSGCRQDFKTNYWPTVNQDLLDTIDLADRAYIPMIYMALHLQANKHTASWKLFHNVKMFTSETECIITCFSKIAVISQGITYETSVSTEFKICRGSSIRTACLPISLRAIIFLRHWTVWSSGTGTKCWTRQLFP